jgi:hypothetical protein
VGYPQQIYVTFFIIKGKKINPRYRECIKYQAIGIGGHALDDNNEFMSVGMKKIWNCENAL